MELKTQDDVKRFVLTANPGEMARYHVGLLARDRIEGPLTLDYMANLLLVYAVAGRLHLVQRRVGFCEYEYFAIEGKDTGTTLVKA